MNLLHLVEVLSEFAILCVSPTINYVHTHDFTRPYDISPNIRYQINRTESNKPQFRILIVHEHLLRKENYELETEDKNKHIKLVADAQVRYLFCSDYVNFRA